MLSPSVDGYTAKQVLDMIHAKTGSKRVEFLCDVLNKDGAHLQRIPISGTVRNNKNNSIRRTARLTIRGEYGIDFISQQLKPYAHIKMPDGGFASFSLGVFIPSTPRKTYENNQSVYEVECYDRTVIMKEDSLTERLYFTSRTKYTDAVTSILISAGAEDILIDESDISLRSEREFEPGTSKLEIINTLLSEANYRDLDVNADGTYIVRKYYQPSSDRVSYIYMADDMSIISEKAVTTMDAYSVPNVFMAVISSPEEGALSAMYINDNPASPLSIQHRGRRIVSKIHRPDSMADQASLDAYITRIAFENSQVFEEITFETSVNPLHESEEVLSIIHPDFDGVFEEISWEISMNPGARMRHVVRRISDI